METVIDDPRISNPLAVENYTTLADLILDGIGNFIGRFTGNAHQGARWYCAPAYGLLVWLLGALTAVLFGEATLYVQNAIWIPIALIFAAFSALYLVTVQVLNRQIISSLCGPIASLMESPADRADLGSFLRLWSNKQAAFWVALIYALAVGPFMFYATSEVMGATVSRLLFAIPVSFPVGIIVYHLLLLIVLPLRLEKYKYQMFEIYPASSEIIDRISNMIRGAIFILAGFGAIFMLTFAVFGALVPSTAALFILGLWLPLIVLFATMNHALRQIISTTKRQTLNEIEDRIKLLTGAEDLATKATLVRVNNLMDYYERVRATPDGAFNFRAALGFLNSLLLPVIGYLLGNLDTILARFF